MSQFDHITLPAYVKCPVCDKTTRFNVEVEGPEAKSALLMCEHCGDLFAATYNVNLIVIAEPVVANGSTTSLNATVKPADYQPPNF